VSLGRITFPEDRQVSNVHMMRALRPRSKPTHRRQSSSGGD
jgi:hypothetical protein